VRLMPVRKGSRRFSQEEEMRRPGDLGGKGREKPCM
jgi:hypothetical protein